MRTPVSERLDRLYGKNIRCPYCHTVIPKFVSTCPNCGISKAQIAEANVKEEKIKEKQPIIWSKIRPVNIPFWKMAIGCVFGFLGLHCFISKRKIRGVIILSLTLGFIIGGFIFHPAIESLGLEAHPWYSAAEKQGLIFPTTAMGLVSIVLWVWDWIAVVFGWYKYPVVVKAQETAK
jgi:hypothetical protein